MARTPTASLHSVAAVRERALRRLPPSVRNFVEGGSDDEVTLRANREAFRRITFRPSVAVDVAVRHLDTIVCGERLALPVLTAPAGLAGVVSPSAEVDAVGATESRGTRSILSTGSSASLEAVAGAATTGHWFQLYPWRDRPFVDRLMDRATRAGFRVLCVTVDVPVMGNRERDVASGMTIPPRWTFSNALGVLRRPRWAFNVLRHRPYVMRTLLDDDEDRRFHARPMSLLERNLELMNPSTSWRDLASLRERWRGMFVVKGILTPEDARRAAEIGADGIVVSNHGGRQLDGAPATIRALPAIAAAVGNDVDILLDGGVCRGSDVVKAVALGAKACLIGRPWLYGAAVDGRRGIENVLEIFRNEIDRTLALTGRPTLRQLGPDAVAVPLAWSDEFRQAASVHPHQPWREAEVHDQ